MITTHRPSTDRPTATYPTGRPALIAPSPSLFVGWRDQAPTELLPVIIPAPTRRRAQAPQAPRRPLTPRPSSSSP